MRKISACTACGLQGHNKKNKICRNFAIQSPVGRVNTDLLTSPNLPVDNVVQNDEDTEEEEDDNAATNEDQVLNEIDVDEGVAHEDQTNGIWRDIGFEDEDAVPLFDSYSGANVEFMRSIDCTTCLDSFACYFDDRMMQTFVDATQNWGVRKLGRAWKELTVNEFKIFLAIILVLGLVPVTSRNSAWGENGLGIPFIKNLMSKGRFSQLLRAWRYEDESNLTDEQIKRNVKAIPFWYVKSFVETLRVKFQTMYSLGQKVDIDEQCIPWKGRHVARCYNPKKPEKWHFKNFSLNDASNGYMHNVYTYEGSAENRPRNVPATLFPIHQLFLPRELYSGKIISWLRIIGILAWPR